MQPAPGAPAVPWEEEVPLSSGSPGAWAIPAAAAGGLEPRPLLCPWRGGDGLVQAASPRPAGLGALAAVRGGGSRWVFAVHTLETGLVSLT